MKIALALFFCLVSSVAFARDECRGELYTWERCIGLAAQGGERDPHADSDCDGLSDNDEDINSDCLCEPEETCWYNNDTDGDGCMDGRDNDSLNFEPNCFGLDSDGDDLSDICETRLGTDPHNRDTDGDGLTDGMEDANRNCIRDVAETDPLRADTDGDGLSDGLEVRTSVSGCNGIVFTDLFTDPLSNDTDHDGVSDYDEIYRLHSNPADADSDNDGQSDGIDVCPCDPNPNCTPPPQPICVNGDAGDAPAVGSATEIRRGAEILRSEKDVCYPQGRQRPDVLKEYYCDPQSGQIMLHWYICKPSAPNSPVGCTTDAQGLGHCPAADAHLITNPALIPLP